MKKWLFVIAIGVFIVMGILASSLGLNPSFGMHNKFLFSFASGVNGIGRIIAIFILALLIVCAVVIAISAFVDIFNNSKRE